MEIQANAIRQDKKRCIIIYKEEIKLSTDDMITYIEHIKESTTTIKLELICNYIKIAGCKVNKQYIQSQLLAYTPAINKCRLKFYKYHL